MDAADVKNFAWSIVSSCSGESKRNIRDAASRVLFEDGILQCHGCGAPLFPEALVKRLRTRIPSMEGIGVLFDLCPSCRMKTQRAGERVEKSK